MNEKRILFIQNGKTLATAVSNALSLAGYQVLVVEDADLALPVLGKQRFNLVIGHLLADPAASRLLLKQIKESVPELPVLFISVQREALEHADRCAPAAEPCLVEPVAADELLENVEKLTASPDEEKSEFVASDPVSCELLRLARRVAATDVSVLISGESGTGKEVLARYIHSYSARANGPMVAINCAAIPENMLEAVLFGYEKGAFTGAHQAHAGKFEQAQGGVLLLDEIAEMDLSLQAKLLRVLQEREVERLGSRKAIALDVRVLAATNRELREAVLAGRFREDLYYRLNVFPLHLSPLRNRKADIAVLAERLIERHAVSAAQAPVLSEGAVAGLQAHDWPGNVRELENVVQRALVMCNGATIEARDLHLEPPLEFPRIQMDEGEKGLSSDLKIHEHDLIIEALQRGNGSRKSAAERLGISPRTLRYKLAKMRDNGVEVPSAYGMA